MKFLLSILASNSIVAPNAIGFANNINELKMLENKSTTSFVDSFGVYLKGGVIQKNFVLDLENIEKDDYSLTFINQLVEYLNDTHIDVTPEIIIEAFKIGELQVNFEKIDGNDFNGFAKISLKTVLVNKENKYFKPGEKMEINNLRIFLMNKISPKDLTKKLKNIKISNKDIRLNNYKEEKVILTTLKKTDLYLNENWDNSIYSKVANFLVKYRNQYDVKVERITKGYDINFKYVLTPKENNSIFNDKSAFVINVTSMEKHEDKIKVIKSEQKSASAKGSWSKTGKAETEKIWAAMYYKDVDQNLNNLEDLKQHYQKIKFNINGVIGGYSQVNKEIIFGNVRTEQVKAPGVELNLEKVTHEYKSNTDPTYLEIIKGTTRIYGYLKVWVYEKDGYIQIAVSMNGTAKRAGAYTAKIELRLQLESVELISKNEIF